VRRFASFAQVPLAQAATSVLCVCAAKVWSVSPHRGVRSTAEQVLAKANPKQT